jgi:acyl carrier protein
MTSPDADQVLRSLLTQEFLVDETAIAPDVSFKDMGLDSLDVVALVMALEDRLGVEIPEEDLDGLKRFGEVLDLLERKVAARA